MPLQKLSSNGPLSVSSSTSHRPQLQNRRRTLQTISELPTNEEGLPDFVSSIGIESIRRVAHDNTPGVGRSTCKSVRRKSLPQYHSSPDIHVPRPSITVTSAQGPESSSRRAAQGRRTMSITTYQVEGWNAKRERARMWHELAIAEARAQRSISDQGAVIAMSAVRPSTSSRPTSLRHSPSEQTSLGQSNLSSCLSGQVERRASLGSTNNNTNSYDVRPAASERTSTDSSSYQSRDSAINRSRSDSSNTSYTSQDAHPLSHGTASDMKGYCTELTLQNQNLVAFGESARSRNLNPSRSSRTLSLPADVFKHTHRYVTALDLHQLPAQQPQQIRAQRARNQALAALTSADSHTRTIRRGQYPASPYTNPHQNRHAGLTSHPPNTSAYRKPDSPHRIPLRYYSQHEGQRRITLPSPAHLANDVSRPPLHPQPEPPRRVSFETRTVPKRESLTQWKKEREEAKASLHTDHKARMQERVRRANELEQEKEKELVSMGKRPAETESRSCFGGLFAVLRGKRT